MGGWFLVFSLEPQRLWAKEQDLSENFGNFFLKSPQNFIIFQKACKNEIAEKKIA